MDCFPGRECRKFFLLFWCFHNLKEQTLPKLQPIIFDLQGPLLKSPNSQFLLCRKITKTSLCSFFCLFFLCMHCLEEGGTRVVRDLGTPGGFLDRQCDVLGGWGCPPIRYFTIYLSSLRKVLCDRPCVSMAPCCNVQSWQKKGPC